jgi:hypothetical protein
VGQAIWRAIMDMHATKRSITRQALSDMTGLKLTLVDDHVKRMRSDGRLRLVINGVFEPVVMPCARTGRSPPRSFPKATSR